MNIRSRLIGGMLIIACVFGFLKWNPFAANSKIPDKPLCPAISDVSIRPFGELDFNGATNQVKENGLTDDYLQDRDGANKVALREEWGASLVFFGHADKNTLDNSALGRGLQVVFHDDSRATQGCAFNSSCFSKKESKSCTPGGDFLGWQPAQAGNKCGEGTALDLVSRDAGLVATFQPLLANPGWNAKECHDGCSDQSSRGKKARMRITQSLRFIKSGVLEVDYLVTNLEPGVITASLGTRNEFPALFASLGTGAVLRNTRNNAGSGKREPAASEKLVGYLRNNGGWASFQNNEGDYGVGIYWENRNESLSATQIPGAENSLRSNFAFSLPASDSIRGRFYLLLGGYTQVKELAETLDRTLPPFGRIETNQIEPDTRTVTLTGWALDNKGIKTLELWVDGKKISDLALNAPREDICATYPGYAMCAQGHKSVGFETTYTRPAGTGCERPVEVRAVDSDGNSRIISRKSISPVVY